MTLAYVSRHEDLTKGVHVMFDYDIGESCIGPRPSTDDGDCSSMCDIYRSVSGRAVWVGQMVYSDAIARIQRHKEWFSCRDDLIPF